MLGLKSLRMHRNFSLVRPSAYFVLDIGWMEQFHLANNFTMTLVFSVGYDFDFMKLNYFEYLNDTV